MATQTLERRIVDRGVQMASVRGLYGVTIGGLAKDLGISKGGVCAHFPSKEDLQLAVVAGARELFDRVVLLPVSGVPEGALRLEMLSASWFRYLEAGTFDGGCFFTNAVIEVDDRSADPVRDAVFAGYELFLTLVEHHATIAVELGQFGEDVDPATFTFEYCSAKVATLLWRSLGVADAIELGREQARLLLARSTVGLVSSMDTKVDGS